MGIMHRYQVELAPDSFTRKRTEGIEEFFTAFDPAAGYEHISKVAVAPVLRALLDSDSPRVLDLMAGSDSHLGSRVTPSEVVGIGRCTEAMARNSRLDQRLEQNLDEDPALPFPDACFDLVISTGSVGYLSRGRELFAEAARVLKPEGLMLVIYDNRSDEERVIKAWRRGSEEERLALVDHYLKYNGRFSRSQVRVSKLRSGPAGLVPGRPLYAVFALRSDAPASRTTGAELETLPEHRFTPDQIEERKGRTGETMRCPYCDHPLNETEIPDTPFNEWDTDRLWVCLAPDCPFTLRSLHVMGRQGNLGVAYRVAYHRERDHVYTISDTNFADRG